MRRLPLLVTAVLCACGGAPHVPETQPRALVDEGCRFTGVLAYGPLLHQSAGYPVAQGHDFPAEATLADGPSLGATVRAEGFELDVVLPPELDVVGPTRLGSLLYVGPRHDVSVVGVGPEGVRIGPPAFVGDELRLSAPAEIWVQCEDLALRGTEMSDPDADLRTFGFVARGERAVPAGVALELRGEHGGPVLGTLSPSENPRVVTLLEEVGGAARIAIDHWQDVLIVGWVEASALAPTGSGVGMLGLLGALGAPQARDITVCTPTAALELLVQQVAFVADDGTATRLEAPSEVTVLGTVAAGTRLVRIADRGDGLVQVEPHPSAPLSVPMEAHWLVRSAELGSACTGEHIEPPSFGSIFGPG